MNRRFNRTKFLFTFLVSFGILSIPLKDQTRIFDKIHSYIPSILESAKKIADTAVDEFETTQSKNPKYIEIPEDEYKSIKALKAKLEKERPFAKLKKSEKAKEEFDNYDYRE